jgi:hypothetical protein|tara:strand:+ start:632 stop:865 length:234 start_codon:yes stop_codon:yes gene_type:complete
MKNNNSVKFVYDKHDVEFGNNDIMFPQTETNVHKEVKLGPDDPLEDYFDSFYKFLMQIGFTKKEIEGAVYTSHDFFD